MSEKSNFSLTVEAPGRVGYIDCFLHTPVSFRIGNRGAEAERVTLVAESADGLIVRFEREADVPFGSTVKLSVPDLFSPRFLAEGGEPRPARITARLLRGEQEICRESVRVIALPYGYWEGLNGNAARLAAFVRPREPACLRLLQTALPARLGAESPYLGGEREVRRVFGAVFSALRACGVSPAPPADLTAPASADGAAFFAGSRPVTRLEAGIAACAVLETAGLHPVLAVGTRVAVGVWLYDTSLFTGATDDGEVMEKYLGELAFFDAADLFTSVGIAASERKVLRAFRAGEYAAFTDVFRCRAEGIAPPSQESAPREEAPAAVFRGRAWERRLLDFSARNPLLRFSAKHALRVACADADACRISLSSPGGMRLSAGALPGLAAPERELVGLERGQGILRAYADEEETAEKAAGLCKASREAETESGAKVLYLAFGLLHFAAGGESVCAPVALLPVRLERADGYRLQADGGFFLNSTLFEYLGIKTEEGVPLGEAAFPTVASAFRAVRAAGKERGFFVTEEAYLGIFRFRNYFLWHDLRRNFAEFCRNENVLALLRGRAQPRPEPAPGPPWIALPLEADRSQEEAVALSDTGASFILHGPPGTGKSQTIANLIAHALGQGKRVLFVAEKKAALDVVVRRLERIGLGDFCLELNAERTDRAEVARKIENTLSLSFESGGGDAVRAFSALLKKMRETRRALHERGGIGVSVAEAIARYFERERTAEIEGGSPAFYEGLTAEKFALCRHELAALAAEARACAVRGAPFEHVELFAYTEGVRERVVCAVRAVLLAGKHFCESAELFFGLYRQSAPVLTRAKIEALVSLAERLLGGGDAVYFEDVSEEELLSFCRANDALDALLREYSARFRTLILPDGEGALARYGREGGDWRLNASLRGIAGRLARASREGLAEEDVHKSLKTLSAIHAALHVLRTGPFSVRLCDRRGEVRQEMRENFLKGLRALERAGEAAFGAFGREAFFSACVRAAKGSARPVLGNFCAAARGFLAAFDEFLAATGGSAAKLEGEDLPAYIAQKGAAILENADLLRSHCRCREAARRLESEGVGNVTAALGRDGCGAEGLVAAFEKGVYRRLIERRVFSSPALAGGSSEAFEQQALALTAANGAAMEQTRKTLRETLLSRLPKEGEFPAERAALARQARGNAHGGGLRGLLAEIPSLVARACPCLVMSPSSAVQLLPPQANGYDIVVFDEASQMSTAEAVGCLARAKAAIVAGDPNQLPPTRFFRASRPEEEEEDGESVLDDFLALGMPARHLLWHYRSRHESLIAFSNAAYYHNALRTVPPPDAGASRVRLVRVDGVYERGDAKRNRAEAEALAEEIARRLSDPICAKKSMGVVTFSVAQKEEIERQLSARLCARGLESAAYAREEPLFVKNLENVQGDERDVIFFSVCYGADAAGKLSLNFGPLNRAGGWRRLNVAASRAREEMLVYSSLSASSIDADKTSSRGVLGLKAFLEFAETGKTLCDPNDLPAPRENVGAHLSRALGRLGYACRRNVGASAFRVDVAVLDPADRSRYLLALLLDGAEDVKDGVLLKRQLLEQAGWTVLFVSSVGYYSNPKRELERIKRTLDALTGQTRARSRYARPYRAVKAGAREPAGFLTDGANREAVVRRLCEIVAREEPISRAFLKKRCLQSFGIPARGSRALAYLDRLIDGCPFRKDRVYGVDYFYRNPRAICFSRYRTEGKRPLRREAEDYTVYEVVSMVKGALEEHVALYEDELSALFEREFHAEKANGELASFLLRCIRYGEEKGLFVRSPSDKISLA